MLDSGIDLESYINEYTLVYEDCRFGRQVGSLAALFVLMID